jgi:hypothetical protein
MVRLSSIIVLLFGWIAVPAWGCRCMGNPVCAQIAPHGAMFTGKILSVQNVERTLNGMNRPVPRRVFKVEVSESFVGGYRVGEEVEIETGLGNGDCGYGFIVGERYLIDVWRGETGLQTSICSATAPESLAEAAVRELRTIAAGGRIPDLSGLIRRVEQGKPEKGIGGIAVVLTAADGRREQTITDESGTYFFNVLASGMYTIAAALPPDLATQADASEKPQEVTIPDRASQGAACHVSVTGRLKNGISGVVVDEMGRPLTGSISAFPATWNGAWPAIQTDKIGTDGSFLFMFLPEGEYKLQVYQPDSGAGKRWYYPSGPSKAEAGTVRVERGRITGELRLVVRAGTMQ